MVLYYTTLHNEAQMNEVSLKIGEVAKQVGVATGTLRYYESVGLIKAAYRHANGYRYYDAEAIQQVQFIKKAQSIGFSYDIQQIMTLKQTGLPPCQFVKSVLRDKIDYIKHQIQQLQHLQHELESYQNQWQKPDDLHHVAESTICHLIEGVSRVENVGSNAKVKR